jgi:type IX secretion system PorP/SprF family membrane protein
MRNLINFKSKVAFLLIAFIGLSKAAFAQQEILYSQYMFNTLAVNPSYAGSRDVLSLTALGRFQWLGVDGAPTTYSFSVDMPFKNEKMGLGISAYNDALGLQNNTGVSIAYAYRVKLGQKTTLSLGLSPNVSKVGWNLTNTGLTSDLSFSQNINRIFVNSGAGMFISNDRSYLGFSVPQIIEWKFKDDEAAKITRHYYTMMGFVLGKRNFKIKPSTMIRITPGAPVGIDGNINVWYKDKIAFGFSARKSQTAFSGPDNLDALVGMFELQLTPQIRFGYAYDWNLNRLNYSNGSGSQTTKGILGTPTHEGLLRYEFGYGKNKILTPRYF